MMDNQILVGAQRQEELEAAKAAFFASGGQAEKLDGPTFKPLPFRRHPEPKPKIQKKTKEDAKQQRSTERVALIAEMAKTMTCREISQELGIPQNTLWTMSQRCDFKFVPGVQGGRTKPYTDATEDTKMAERITALRDIGLSRYQVQKQMSICNRTLLRIIKAFEIDFPRAKGKRCDGPI
jgi:transposase